MKKTLLIAALFLLVFSAKAQDIFKNYYTVEKDGSIELDITNYDFYERFYTVYNIYNDSRFDISEGKAYGLFKVDTKDDFDGYLNKLHADFGKLDKYDLDDLFIIEKDILPKAFATSILFDLSLNNVRNDNDTCVNSKPFCTSEIITFEASHSTDQAEPVPDKACLGYTYNPSWYHMRINTPGQFIIHMEGRDPNNTNIHRDIDYCIWGPFTDPTSPCVQQLNTAHVIDCSYSNSYSENVYLGYTNHGNHDHNQYNTHVPETGEYYILLITNYSRDPCIITFTKQTNSGPGETDCSIIEPFLTANTPCYGDNLTLEADEIAGATYTWTSPDNQSHGGRTWTRSNATLNMAGTYTCHVVAGTQSGDENINVVVLPRPNANFTVPSQCIMGQAVQFTGTETTTPSGHNSQITSRSWNFGDGGSGTGANPTHTYNNPGTYQVTYTVTITGGDDGTCENSKTIPVTVTSSMSANITGDNSVCQNESITLHANASGGSGTFHYTWKKNGVQVGGDSPTLTQNMTEAGTYQFTCDINDGYTTQTPSISVTVNALPSVDIQGPNHVSFGASANLSVTPLPGATYQWTPANLIATGQGTANVTTVGLESDEPVTIDLKIITAQGCENSGHITISLGNQLYAYSEITGEPALCKHYSTTLKVTATGGSGEYTYHWEPANMIQSGQSSDNIETKELEATTSFTCTVNDGIHTYVTEAVSVTVWQVENVEYTPTDLQCNEYYWEEADETFTEHGDHPRTFYNENGCAYIKTLHLNNNNLRFTTYGEEPTTRKDECVDADGYYIWESPNAIDSYSIYMEYEGYEYRDSHEFQGVDGCPRVEYNWLKLYSQPTVDDELYGDTLVESGFGYLPHIYEYYVQNLAGAGTEGDYPPEYTWSIHSYYDTPNHIGPDGASAWYLVEDPDIKNKIYVYTIAEGNALLRCDISTKCGTVGTEKFIWTEGYKYPGYSVDEIDYNKMVNIYPNPTSGELFIGCSDLISNSRMMISIYSYDGTMIDLFYSNGDVTPYSMNHLADGIYMVKIVGKEFSITKKLVLSR